jgi:hypothetical protein
MRLAQGSTLLMVVIAGSQTSTVQAQPSDAQTKRDLTSRGVLSVKLHGRGAKVWSSLHSQYVWDRTATVIRKANIPEFPNAKLEIVGIASYSILGGRYPFRKFLVAENRYIGIPTPSAAAIVAMVKKDLPGFLGFHYNRIVGEVQPITLAADPKWYWHTPNSVSMMVTAAFSEKVSDTELEKKKMTFEVRLYRDAIKKPWKSFGSSSKTEVSLGKMTRDADALAAMKTLDVIDAERVAKARLATLPAVQIPAFKTDLELFAWLHKTLREGGAGKTEAVLRRMLAPQLFRKGSDVLLDDTGERMVQDTVQKAFKGKSTYAEQYGAEPNIESYSANEIVFINADGKHRSSISLEPAGGSWQNGVKTGQSLKIKQINIGLNTNADEIARLRSLPPATRFALPPGSKSFAQWGGQVAEEKQAQVQAEVVRAISWTPFTSTNARLKMSFPATPQETEGQMNGKYPMWTVEATHPQVLCRAIAVIYPTRLNRMQAQTTVDSALQQLAQANNATMQRPSELNEGTYGKLATLEKEGAVMKARVFVQGDVLYQLILSGSPATMATLNERDFFGSFQATR